MRTIQKAKRAAYATPHPRGRSLPMTDPRLFITIFLN